MWTQAPAHYKGEHYRIEGAYCEPRPVPVPPVMVGGHGERYLLRVVARHADWWNYPFRGLDVYAQKQEVAQGALPRGRAATTTRSSRSSGSGILIGESEREVERIKARPDTRPLADIRLVGTPGPGDGGAARHRGAGRPPAHRELRRRAAAGGNVALRRRGAAAPAGRLRRAEISRPGGGRSSRPPTPSRRACPRKSRRRTAARSGGCGP